jgi:hypothetical protein
MRSRNKWTRRGGDGLAGSAAGPGTSVIFGEKGSGHFHNEEQGVAVDARDAALRIGTLSINGSGLSGLAE